MYKIKSYLEIRSQIRHIILNYYNFITICVFACVFRVPLKYYVNISRNLRIVICEQ